jgi:hypothetical protein
MFGEFFSSLGGSLGNSLGGGIFSVIGRFAGKMLGNYLDRHDYEPDEFYNYKNIKDSFSLIAAIPGEPIALIFGKTRVIGKIIWAGKVLEVQNSNTEKKYFTLPKQTKSIHHTIECEYFVSFAMAICEGEILEIGRVWAGDELIDLGNYKFRLYEGSETQEPNPVITASSEDNQAPAFRGLSYIVFEDFPLDDFGQTIPVFSFEVTRKANVDLTGSVEEAVKSIVMIPGSGEFVYDTVVQHKIIKNYLGAIINKEAINSHNYHKKANSLFSLDQLQNTCSNIEWVAVVACWFGDNTDAKYCNILPGVEHKDINTETTEEWRVANFNRATAKLISRDHENNPRYGGSVNDASIVRYLMELKARGIKVMFYPMIFLDVEKKPWRGHLTGDLLSIRDFFNKQTGYNQFILHYARLVKDHVDSFVIGSEMIGLTKIKDNQNRFPAVEELIKLAKSVKDIMGQAVLVTYAADWSEYHHTEGGWYNLDELWACPSIDFVGIDAYFPVTNSIKSSILPEEIINGWKSGEGFDFYYDHERKKHPLAPEYAWKNLKHWWSSSHKNPDGSTTKWQPKMKKIWFTEFGFPSIDKSTNQPNVFFDPFCVDGGVPRHSSGEIDFSIQRRAIKAFIDYWESEEYIDRTFLWTWDARPYPAWPHMDIWRDGYLWEKGHWVNNKFGASSIAAIIMEISKKCDIPLEKIDVRDLDESVEGVIFNGHLSGFDAINILRISHFFDITACWNESIRFARRGFSASYPASSNNFIKISDNNCLIESEVSKHEIINKLQLYFIDCSLEYKMNYVLVNNEIRSNRTNVKVNLPIVMSTSEMDRIGKMILNNALIEDRIITFIVPSHSLKYEPTDLIELEYKNKKFTLRIINILKNDNSLKITGIIDNAVIYYLPTVRHKELLSFEAPLEDQLIVLDLPQMNGISGGSPQIVCYLKSYTNRILYASLSGNIPEYYNKVSSIKNGAVIGSLTEVHSSIHANIFVTDELSRFVISCKDLETHIKQGESNLALLGQEIIDFKYCRKLWGDLFEITHIIRGQFATDSYMNSHSLLENFVLLKMSANIITASEKIIGRPTCFKAGNFIVEDFIFHDKQNTPLAPYIRYCQLINNHLEIEWVPRYSGIDNWKGEDFAAPRINLAYIISVKVDRSEILREIVVGDNRFSKKISGLNISGAVEVSIIAKDTQDRESTPVFVIATSASGLLSS